MPSATQVSTNSRSMTLRFLGTAAAEAYPAPFCSCIRCEIARRNGGRDIRRRSALLVNDDLLIDFGPDVFGAALSFGLRFTNLHTVCLTHSHEDHLAANDFAFRGPVFRGNTVLPQLDVYGPDDAIDMIRSVSARYLEAANMRLVPVKPGETWYNGDYKITAIPAIHGNDKMICLLYLIEKNGRRFFYGTDTGPLVPQAWELLQAAPPHVAILDSTMGILSSDKHMGFDQVRTEAAHLRKLTSEPMTIIAHHFSHNANPCHDDLVRLYAADDIQVSYDGMVLDV